ncbi:hypothetical protein [Microvirga pudoricolor]|uniref:hypothetical protein n=1 Tax=Microvirga pudoricolor TaxID=2778729 RepID=UPI00194EF886|nr:hypothetical protein [Microvirga pudoricolor]MBM6594477.1 hypothetical protein [Microvirga pudoricolor]
MNAADARTDAGPLTYTQNPKPIGSPISFVLKGSKLSVDTGRKQYDVQLGAVEEVRMVYEPGRVSQRVFRTKIRMKNGRTFSFSSLHWTSMVQAQELGPAYRGFTSALFETIARANPKARFVAGQPLWRWAATTAIAVLCLGAMAVLTWRALQTGAQSVALMGGLLAAVGIWQLEPMVRLNKPRRFSPDAPPPELLPKI